MVLVKSSISNGVKRRPNSCWKVSTSSFRRLPSDAGVDPVGLEVSKSSSSLSKAGEASKIALISYKLNELFYLKIANYLTINIFVTLIIMFACHFMDITFLVPTLMFSVMFIFNMYLLRNIHQEIYDFGQKEKQTETATSTVKKLDYALDM